MRNEPAAILEKKKEKLLQTVSQLLTDAQEGQIHFEIHLKKELEFCLHVLKEEAVTREVLQNAEAKANVQFRYVKKSISSKKKEFCYKVCRNTSIFLIGSVITLQYIKEDLSLKNMWFELLMILSVSIFVSGSKYELDAFYQKTIDKEDLIRNFLPNLIFGMGALGFGYRALDNGISISNLTFLFMLSTVFGLSLTSSFDVVGTDLQTLRKLKRTFGALAVYFNELSIQNDPEKIYQK